MKKVLLALLLVFVLFSISCKQQGGKVTVRVDLQNNPGKQSVYLDLIEMDGSGPVSLDTVLVEQGSSSFSFEGGDIDPDLLYNIRFEKDLQPILLVPDQKDIKVSIDLATPGYFASNSPGSNSFRSLLREFENRLQGIDSLKQQLVVKDATMDSSRVALEENFRNRVNATGKYLLAYADSSKTAAVAMYALILARDVSGPDQVKPIIAGMEKRFTTSKSIAKLAASFKEASQEQPAGSLLGKPAPDFSLPDPNGKMISLSSFKGKYVLVDFWAAWCRPCRMENPNVVEAFEKYKRKNFTVLGVSLDKDKDAWMQAISEDKLFWPQVSDLKFWQSAVVPLYNIEGIPFNVLLDPNGTVIAQGLRGKDLHDKLESILK